MRGQRRVQNPTPNHSLRVVAGSALAEVGHGAADQPLQGLCQLGVAEAPPHQQQLHLAPVTLEEQGAPADDTSHHVQQVNLPVLHKNVIRPRPALHLVLVVGVHLPLPPHRRGELHHRRCKIRHLLLVPTLRHLPGRHGVHVELGVLFVPSRHPHLPELVEFRENLFVLLPRLGLLKSDDNASSKELHPSVQHRPQEDEHEDVAVQRISTLQRPLPDQLFVGLTFNAVGERFRHRPNDVEPGVA
mmetsp:Transcript_89599/g.240297  ORF Transcript_89599/g.240297 Transcript_89599/m.240297 type:complete len:244 (+) Transcript_89599:1257-1988(+)